MMLLEEALVCGGVSFHPPCTSRVYEGVHVRVTGRQIDRATIVLRSVVGGVEVRPPLGDLGRALFSQALER